MNRLEYLVRDALQDAAAALCVDRTATDPAADLSRARAARRRRRRRRGTLLAGSAVLAALALMLATGASSQGPGPGGSRLRLAAYDGRQPASFRVSAVPAGFREYRVGPNEIDFAGPPDNRPARPLIAPAPAPATGVDPHDVLPLSVLLTPAAQRPANAWDARRVDVNGRPAVLYRLSGSAGAPGVQRLDVSVSPGRELVVWIGPLLPWAPSEVVAFADGIHIA